ncbi:MAG TPA: hypothetical protein VGX03_33210 [Candidatus Binatia bacterium]|nr:hypothetical protein [Candidatus Binatia bacterium]
MQEKPRLSLDHHDNKVVPGEQQCAPHRYTFDSRIQPLIVSDKTV